MQNFLLSIIMFICIVPALLIMYFIMYPREWKNKKRIFGINNRKEFETEKSAEFITTVAETHRKQATVILAILLVLSVLCFFIPVFYVQMTVWTVFIIIALVVIAIPYILGNSELKKYKKCLGIVSDNVLYADLKNAGNVHALNTSLLAVANIAGLLILVLSLLTDLGIVPIDLKVFNGSFVLTMSIGAVLFTNIILIPIAFMVDHSRNQVISNNSDVNANYNRAVKKLFSDSFIFFTFIDDIVALILFASFILLNSEVTMIAIMGIYMLVIMGEMAVYVSKRTALDNRYYAKESTIVADDDDYWILGMIYYNPNDSKLNVDKRYGMGMTVNMAHPVGKLIGVFCVLSLVASIIVLVWIGMMGATPIKVYDNGQEIVCHHLWDELKIEKSEIVSVEKGDLKEFKAVKTAGTGMDNCLKGKFTVNGEAGCTLFMNPQADMWIKINTNEKTYYISDNTKEGTESIYEAISE